MNISRKKLLRMTSLALAVLLCLSFMTPFAVAEGSPYIGSYGGGMTTGSNGNVTVSFQITGVGKMDEIGSTKVVIYENGTSVKTYLYSNTSGMMGYNKTIHGSTVTYAGTVGKSYSAYITFQAGKDGDWENRGMSTNSVTAKT